MRDVRGMREEKEEGSDVTKEEGEMRHEGGKGRREERGDGTGRGKRR